MADNSDTEDNQGGQPGDGQPQDGQSTDGQPTGGQPTDGQPASGQPNGGQPTGGQPAGGSSTSTGIADELKDPFEDPRAAMDILSEDSAQNYVKYCVGIFLAIGIGFSLSFVFLELLSPSTGSLIGSGGIALVGLVFAFILTPLLSGVLGIIIGLQMDDTRKAAVLASGVGSFAGYIAFLILLIFMSAIVGDGGSLGEALVALVGWGIGVAFAGAATAGITRIFLTAGVSGSIA